jgi:hypothetical protein
MILQSRHPLDRILRPQVTLAVLATVLVLGVLFSPSHDPDQDVPLLTTRSSEGRGARGLYEVVDRLGWHVERRDTPLRGDLDTTAAYLILDPPVDLTGSEVGAVLAAVRRGAGLIVVPLRNTPLADSIGVHRSRWHIRALETGGAPTRSDRPEERRTPDVRYTLQGPRTARDDTVVFLTATDSGRPRPVVVGFPDAHGRVVAIADPVVLRNDVIRHGAGGVLAVRLVEYAMPHAGGHLTFAEYYFGYGRHSTVERLVGDALVYTAPGRAAVVIILAALILLLAVSPRPITPIDRVTIERRSPLEHVGALARAYEQIGATRASTRRLVRGLRRRHPALRTTASGGQAESEEDYLAMVRTRYPAVATDVALLEHALRLPQSPAEFRALGAALGRIEHTIAPPRADDERVPSESTRD